MVQILINKVFASNATVHIRIPSWAGNVSIKINNREYAFKRERKHFPPTASGYDPRYSYFLPIARKWADGDVLEMWFDLPLRFRRASAKVRGHKGKIAVSCGPLLYCLESCDNNDLDIFTAVLDSTSAQRDFSPDLLGGTPIIRARTINDQSLTLIPYYLWANRGQSQMTVWIAST